MVFPGFLCPSAQTPEAVSDSPPPGDEALTESEIEPVLRTSLRYVAGENAEVAVYDERKPDIVEKPQMRDQ